MLYTLLYIYTYTLNYITLLYILLDLPKNPDGPQHDIIQLTDGSSHPLTGVLAPPTYVNEDSIVQKDKGMN